VNYNDVVSFVQQHFTDGLVLIVGSGLSAAEGMPGMPDLADHLLASASELIGDDGTLWSRVATALEADEGLEAALLKHPPTESLEAWIAKKTCDFLLPKERELIGAVVKGERTLRLTSFLLKVLKPPNGLPILTPNYDRLIEVACERAGFHVDTTAIGHYAGAFDHRRSCMGSCRAISSRGKTVVLDHFPRAIVLKPHGSFDWYRNQTAPFRCTLDLDAERLIITPGLNKYRAGYDAPFDKHRDLANDYIKSAARLLVIGYGFNDDHLHTHLLNRIQGGTPTLVMTRSANENTRAMLAAAPRCVCLSKPTAGTGVEVVTKDTRFEQQGKDLWDLGIMTQELLT
jgi:hypothetical protein